MVVRDVSLEQMQSLLLMGWIAPAIELSTLSLAIELSLSLLPIGSLLLVTITCHAVQDSITSTPTFTVADLQSLPCCRAILTLKVYLTLAAVQQCLRQNFVAQS